MKSIKNLINEAKTSFAGMPFVDVAIVKPNVKLADLNVGERELYVEDVNPESLLHPTIWMEAAKQNKVSLNDYNYDDIVEAITVELNKMKKGKDLPIILNFDDIAFIVVKEHNDNLFMDVFDS